VALIQENVLFAYKYLFMNCVYCWRERERERERDVRFTEWRIGIGFR